MKGRSEFTREELEELLKLDDGSLVWVPAIMGTLPLFRFPKYSYDVEALVSEMNREAEKLQGAADGESS